MHQEEGFDSEPHHLLSAKEFSGFLANLADGHRSIEGDRERKKLEKVHAGHWNQVGVLYHVPTSHLGLLVRPVVEPVEERKIWQNIDMSFT